VALVPHSLDSFPRLKPGLLNNLPLVAQRVEKLRGLRQDRFHLGEGLVGSRHGRLEIRPRGS
jgi:hypothetical protein